MDVKIFSKNLEINPQTQDYIQKKFNRLERHLKRISDAKLEVSRTSARAQSERVVAQLTLTANGYTLRGQESGLNLFAAIDAVTDVMDRQIRKYKGKVYRSAQAKRAGKAGSGPGDGPLDTTDTEAEPEDIVLPEVGKAVRTKRFPMKPMTVEDAILEMELLSHDFFLFHNVDTSEYNVVYRRRDGDYGVIGSELA